MAGNACSIEGCDKPVRGRGYCAGHYSTAYSAGEFSDVQCIEEGCIRKASTGRGLCNACYQKWWRTRPDAPKCGLDGCDRVNYSRKLCRMHYARLLKDGDPGPTGALRQPPGSTYVVGGYRRRKVNGKVILEHREVMEGVLGRPLTSDETVHHINGDPLDNRPGNLQVRTGRHGKGVAHACGDCGSRNIVAVPIDG